MSATKVVLIIVGAFLVLGIIAVGVLGLGVWYVAKSTHKDANGQVTMNLPFGTIHTIPPDQITESDLGIPFYPGARCVTGARSETSGFTQLSAFFLTSDSTDNVIAFYKGKAGTGAQLITLPFGGTQFDVPGQAGTSVRVLITQRKNTSGGATSIQIVRTIPTATPK
jgi:hypothetical protein